MFFRSLYWGVFVLSYFLDILINIYIYIINYIFIYKYLLNPYPSLGKNLNFFRQLGALTSGSERPGGEDWEIKGFTPGRVVIYPPVN